MLRKFHNHFGIPGVIAVVALVFAMMGGAYAASSSDGGKATASAKGKQGPRGKRGPKGATGAAGPAGPAGAPGAKGDAGAPGAAGAKGPTGPTGPTGATGTNGTNGKSVVVTDADEVTECVDVGGVVVEKELEPATAKEVCNGAEGPEGPEGSPWTAGGVLPEGKTLTGAWSFTGSEADTEFLASISFPIELDEELFEETNDLHFTSGGTAECPGNSSAPTAAPGNLCVYFNQFGGEVVNATFDGIFKPGEGGFFEEGASVAGAVVRFLFDGEAGDVASGHGTWAVTGAVTP